MHRVRSSSSTMCTGLLLVALAGGCALDPRSVEQNRLRYNEAVKTTTEQQLLLNIVRLRYTDTPSSLSITTITDQQKIVAGLKAIPFFTADAGGNSFGGFRGSVLPQAELSGANRPTLSYTPLDVTEFTRRLFTPLTLEGAAYLGKTTWPISTVFRLYLENLNWVSNSETACASVAVRYRDVWFYIDDRDRDTKATFALLVELSRLELGAKVGTAPLLTLPLGGR